MSDTQMSIEELKNGSTPSGVKEVNISDIASQGDTQTETPINDVISQARAALQIKKEEVKKEAEQYVEKVENDIAERQLQKEIDEDKSQDFVNKHMKEDSEIEGGSDLDVASINFDDEDFKDLEDENEVNTAKDDKVIQEFKTAIKEQIKPVNKVIDIKSFTISKKTVSVSNALKIAAPTEFVADWALPASGRGISVKEFKGFDIEAINPRSSARNRLNMFMEIYSRIYEHIVDANKPASVEAWLKQTKFSDIDHIYFAIYRSAFHGANLVPHRCPNEKCNEVTMKDINIDTMVKYKDEEAKKYIESLVNKESTSETDEYAVELVQISDDYVIGLKDPSIYNVIFESVVLDEAFVAKYNDLITVLTYVEEIYLIDREVGELRPIELKEYPNNLTKTSKEKIVKYGKIIKSLSSDQLLQFNALIKAVDSKHEEMTYCIPEAKCDKCQTVIPESVQTAESLLFTRHRLVGLATI
jgi:hypothetical protein